MQDPGLLAAKNQRQAVLWLQGFCAAQLLFFGGLCLMGWGLVASAAIDPNLRAAPDDPPLWFIGALLLVYAVPFAAVHVIGVVAPRRPWGYVYGFVVCGMAFMCGGCWFLAIPLLLYWLTPETRAWHEQQ